MGRSHSRMEEDRIAFKVLADKVTRRRSLGMSGLDGMTII